MFTLDAAVHSSYKTIELVHVLDPDEHIQLAKALHGCALEAQALDFDGLRTRVPASSSSLGSPAFQQALRVYIRQIHVAQSLVSEKSAPLEDFVKCRRLLYESMDDLLAAVPVSESTLDESMTASLDVSEVSSPESPEEDFRIHNTNNINISLDPQIQTSSSTKESPPSQKAPAVVVTTRRAPGFPGFATTSKWRNLRVYCGPKGGYFVIINRKKQYVTHHESSFTRD